MGRSFSGKLRKDLLEAVLLVLNIDQPFSFELCRTASHFIDAKTVLT